MDGTCICSVENSKLKQYLKYYEMKLGERMREREKEIEKD